MKTPLLIKRLLTNKCRLCLVLLLTCALPSHAVLVPCSEDFNAVTTPALPEGWTAISQPSYYPDQVVTTIINYSTNNIAVSISNYIQGSIAEYMLISPEISNLNNSLLHFKACNGSQYPATLLVGYMTDPKDPGTFVPLQKIEHMPYFTMASQATGFYDLPAEARYVAFRHGNILEGESNIPIRIDDFELEIMPANPAPSNLYGLGTSASSADLSWSENGKALKWEIRYGAKDFDPSTEGTSLLVENPPSATLENLNDFSFYDFYVRSILADLSQSEWTGPVSFGTYQQ
ncbi:MAG: choice-of-anchor J domain-containing protein, partial [Smithellaceae bacterium]|nr:choice-of-anchor J domain-containing protein [Smithellaceae bacterium]